MGDMADYYMDMQDEYTDQAIDDKMYKYESIVCETEKATLFDLGNDRQVWLPKSVYDLMSTNIVAVEGWFTPTIRTNCTAKGFGE